MKAWIEYSRNALDDKQTNRNQVGVAEEVAAVKVVSGRARQHSRHHGLGGGETL